MGATAHNAFYVRLRVRGLETPFSEQIKGYTINGLNYITRKLMAAEWRPVNAENNETQHPLTLFPKGRICI